MLQRVPLPSNITAAEAAKIFQSSNGVVSVTVDNGQVFAEGMSIRNIKIRLNAYRVSIIKKSQQKLKRRKACAAAKLRGPQTKKAKSKSLITPADNPEPFPPETTENTCKECGEEIIPARLAIIREHNYPQLCIECATRADARGEYIQRRTVSDIPNAAIMCCWAE